MEKDINNQSFNRTIVELKSVRASHRENNTHTFNRTIVELKYFR